MRVTPFLAAGFLLLLPAAARADACDEARTLKARVDDAEREVRELESGPALREYAGNPGAAMALDRQRQADAARGELDALEGRLRDAEARCGQGTAAVPQPPTAPVAPAPVSATPSPTQAPALPGCGKDTDCKGDRICESGKCVDPPARGR